MHCPSTTRGHKGRVILSHIGQQDDRSYGLSKLFGAGTQLWGAPMVPAVSCFFKAVVITPTRESTSVRVNCGWRRLAAQISGDAAADGLEYMHTCVQVWAGGSERGHGSAHLGDLHASMQHDEVDDLRHTRRSGGSDQDENCGQSRGSFRGSRPSGDRD